jgi:hypothetical protein
MDILDSKTQTQLLESLLAEVAKSTNEIRCAQGDLAKAQSRLQFCIAVINQLIERPETQR